MKVEDIMNLHISLIKKFKEDNSSQIPPTLIICRNEEIGVFFFKGDLKDFQKFLMEKFNEQRFEWLVAVNEAYAEFLNEEDKGKIKEYMKNSLKERFESGDKSVKEVITIQVYTRDDKMMSVLDIQGNVLEQTKEFNGYLTIRWGDGNVGRFYSGEVWICG